MTLAIINGKIFSGKSFLENKALILEQGKIKKIVDNVEVSGGDIFDAKGSYITPGFIDLQLNGCGGVLFNDDISVSTLKTMHETNLKFGCTSFLPTLITATEEEIKKAITVAKKAQEEMPNGVIGVHIEGPYISLLKKGIHDPRYIKKLSPEMTDYFVKEAKEIKIVLTLAPEENDLDLVKRVINGGVKVSIGHTNSTYKQANHAIGMGVKLATHLFNAMSPLTHREPGTVGAILDNKEVYSGIIADGHHVDYPVIQMVKELKGEKLYIVTDSVTPAGTDMKTFKFAGQEIYVKDGMCVNREGVLSGANITMIESVKNVALKTSISLIESIRMASLYPSRAIGVNNKLGKIAEDYIANLAIFDNNFKMKATLDNGKLIKLD